MVNWYDAALEYERPTPALDGRWSALSTDWQRELVALMLAHRDINNGGYLQFLANHGRRVYEYAAQTLRAIGGQPMAGILDRCQSLVDKHFFCAGRTREELAQLLPNQIFSRKGREIKSAGSALPKRVVPQLRDLSYEFMAVADDIDRLAQAHYRTMVAGARRG